jgi:hypothetical protein
VFLKGPSRKDIVVTVGREDTTRIPEAGETARIHFKPQAGIALPVGPLASE